MQLKSNFHNFSLIIVILTFIFVLIKVSNKLPVQDSSSFIPPERIGFQGQYDSSALATKVTNALKEDPMLKPIFSSPAFSIHVAQQKSKIILKGAVSSHIFFNRMVFVVRDVPGIEQIDTSQVTILGLSE